MSRRKSPAPVPQAVARPTEAQVAARREFLAAFFARMGGPQQFQALSGHLPDVHFFAKDPEGRFVASSTGVLQKLSFRREEEVIGVMGFVRPYRRTGGEVTSANNSCSTLVRRHSVTTSVTADSADGDATLAMSD